MRRSGSHPELGVVSGSFQSRSQHVYLLHRFTDDRGTTFPSSLLDGDTAKQYFLKQLMQQIQDSEVFEGPDSSKNLALDSQGTTFLHHFLFPHN